MGINFPTAENSGEYVADIVDQIKETAKSTYNEASGVIGSIGEELTSLKDNPKAQGFKVEEIGKPFQFADHVDPYNRGSQFLLTRMNAVDLYPCHYAQAFLSSDKTKKTRFRYGVNYQNAMERYKKMCENYLGSGMGVGAIRVFLTDDTTVTDGISTQYQDNFFQSMADKMSNMAQNITNFAASMSSQAMNAGIDKAIGMVRTGSVQDAVMGKLQGLGAGQKTRDVVGGIVDTLKQGMSIVLKGQKLSLPKIWQNSGYRPVFSVSTKLFSPYGSPKAIKEFIVKPLTYILLLAMPQSDDMVAYGRPFAVTVRSWGTSFLTLAGITNVTLQRGGSDTVYNIYKQPLIVNVNLEFTSLVEGVFSHFSEQADNETPIYEKSSYATVDQILPLNAQSQNIDGSLLPTVVPTLGGIIRSFQPVVFSGVNYGYGKEASNSENISTRGDVMIGGNGMHTHGGVGDFVDMFGETASAFMSPFNAAYEYVTGNALAEGNFGSQLLNGVTNLVSGASSGISMVTGALNNTVNQLGAIANTVTLGAFNQTEIGRTIRKTQNTVNQNVGYLNQAAGAMRIINSTIQDGQISFGSILDWPIGRT